MSKKNIRTVHIDGVEWKWYHANYQDVVIFSPDRERYVWEFREDDGDFIAVNPGKIKDYIIDNILKGDENGR